jgi:hypothetical protein
VILLFAALLDFKFFLILLHIFSVILEVQFASNNNIAFA